MGKILLVDHTRGVTFPLQSNEEADVLVGVLKNLQQGNFRKLESEDLTGPLHDADQGKALAEHLGLKHFSVLDDGQVVHKVEGGQVIDLPKPKAETVAVDHSADIEALKAGQVAHAESIGSHDTRIKNLETRLAELEKPKTV